METVQRPPTSERGLLISPGVTIVCLRFYLCAIRDQVACGVCFSLLQVALYESFFCRRHDQMIKLPITVTENARAWCNHHMHARTCFHTHTIHTVSLFYSFTLAQAVYHLEGVYGHQPTNRNFMNSFLSIAPLYIYMNA